MTMLIPASADLRDHYDDGWQFARLWIGTPQGNGSGGDGHLYVDDIRVYPTDALVTTYYYDQDLGLPITFVDENDKARRFEYDVFGRLIAIRNSADELVKAARQYWNSTMRFQNLAFDPL